MPGSLHSRAVSAATVGSPRPPVTAATLAVLQFLAAALGVIVLLGNGTLDSELSAGDVGLAIGAAVAGAALVGTTWAGLRFGFYLQLLLAPAAITWGATTMTQEENPGLPLVVAGAVWLLLLLAPPSRNWFLRPQD